VNPRSCRRCCSATVNGNAPLQSRQVNVSSVNDGPALHEESLEVSDEESLEESAEESDEQLEELDEETERSEPDSDSVALDLFDDELSSAEEPEGDAEDEEDLLDDGVAIDVAITFPG